MPRPRTFLAVFLDRINVATSTAEKHLFYFILHAWAARAVVVTEVVVVVVTILLAVTPCRQAILNVCRVVCMSATVRVQPD